MGLVKTKLNGLWDFRSGTIIDFSGSNDGSFTSTPIFNRNGLKFDGTDDAISIGNTGITIKTFGIVLNPTTITEDIADMDGGTHTIEVNAGTVTATGWSSPTIYVDGLVSSTLVNTQFQSLVVTTATGFNASALDIGTETTFFDGTISYAFISEDELTQTEINEILAELDSYTYQSSKNKLSNSTSKPSPSENGLVLAYDMKKSDSSVIDNSPTGANGTAVGDVNTINTPFGNALTFNNNTDYINTTTNSDNSSPYTYMFIFRSTDTGYTPIAHHTSNGLHVGGFYTGSSGANLPLIYLSNLGSMNFRDWDISINDGLWHVCAFTYYGNGATDIENADLFVDGVVQTPNNTSTDDSVFAWGNLWIGRTSGPSFYFDGNIADYRIYNRVLSDQEIIDFYNEVRNGQTSFIGNYGVNVSNVNETSGNLSNSEFVINSGTWKISADTINGEEVKVIENVAAGVLYIPVEKLNESKSQAAFGSWEFYIWKDLDTNVTDVTLIGDTIGGLSTVGQDGYGIKFDSDETIALVESVNGTPTDLITSGVQSLQTWYKIDVKRRVTSINTKQFEFLVDNSSIGTVNDNTITSGDYLCLEFDAGDKIAYASKDGKYNFIKRLLP